MELLCHVYSIDKEKNAYCVVHTQNKEKAKLFAFIYEDKQHIKDSLLLSVSYSDSVATSSISVFCNLNIKKMDDHCVHVLFIPCYYIYPWRVVIYYTEEENPLSSASIVQGVYRRHDINGNATIFCFRDKNVLNLGEHDCMKYIIETWGLIDDQTRIIPIHSLLYPPIRSMPTTISFSNDDNNYWYKTGSFNKTYSLVLSNLYAYSTQYDRNSIECAHTASSILIKGDKGSGKTSLVYRIAKTFDIPCILVHAYELTMKSGSDIANGLHDVYRSCIAVAPSILLFDPIVSIHLEGGRYRIEKNEYDIALLKEFLFILEDSKKNGVTVIGTITSTNEIGNSIMQQFDEVIDCYLPTQQERLAYLQSIAPCYIDYMSNRVEETDEAKWRQDYLEYIALNSPSYSWSDFVVTIRKAISVCNHSSPGRTCCLCLLNSFEGHHSDSTLMNGLSIASLPSLPLSTSLSCISSSLQSFSEIGGNHSLKQCLYECIINPCLHWKEYQQYGVAPSTGILLYGPPGTGKTAISRACSQLGHLNFLCPQISDLVCKEIGESERRIRELFEKSVHCSPSIIFFDEIESVFKNREREDGSSVSKQVVTQLLLQIDRINTNNQIVQSTNSFVFIIGATNLPYELDDALLRPGRLDKHILVPLPNHEERIEIILLYSKDSLEYSGDCSLEDLAKRMYAVVADSVVTEGYSGADIKYLIRELILLSIDHRDDTMIRRVLIATMDHVKQSLQKIHPSTDSSEYNRLLEWSRRDR